MILIAHRGLINGPDIELQNNPKQIYSALKNGYNCEIDIRYINKKWWLGHDEPTYKIATEFLIQSGLWIHAKNLEALYQLNKLYQIDNGGINYFWHQNDDFTLTSKGYIWTYPGKELTNKSILVMPEWNNQKFPIIDNICFGVCSDYVENIKNARVP